VYVYLLLCIIIYNVYIHATEIFCTICMSRDSSVDIVTRPPTRRPRNGGSIPSRSTLFLFYAPRRLQGLTQPPIQCISDTFILGVKRRGVKLTIHLRVVQKNAWSYTFTPPYILSTWCLIKHRDNFTCICKHI
jgi:hypothetical protein